MDFLTATLASTLPTVSMLVAALLLILAARWMSMRSASAASTLVYQLVVWFIASVAIIGIVALLPISEQTRGQILGLLGVVLTAVIAISSTTFVANAMAGVMLQATQPFRPGDYIRVADAFGRVTRRSMLHTRIQTESSDFTTLPNLLLVTSPVTVLHREGTIIHTDLSLGYEVHYSDAETLLLQAATDAELLEPFVLVQDLLDHAVSYRICGFLAEMKNPLSARSRLRKNVLQQLHDGGIEIVSPSYMNQRQLDPARRVIPASPTASTTPEAAPEQAPEEKIFEKAEEAASLEDLRQEQEALRQNIKRERAHLKTAVEAEKLELEAVIARLEQREEWLAGLIDRRSAED